jgi:hypothetical protein
MRLRKDIWFKQIVSELKARGFEPGGMACPNIVSSYCRNSMTVEIRGGHMLRVIRHRQEREYPNCSLSGAIEVIEQAASNKD